jgi:hypothetical protein
MGEWYDGFCRFLLQNHKYMHQRRGFTLCKHASDAGKPIQCNKVARYLMIPENKNLSMVVII